MLRLNTATHTATRVAAYSHSPNLFVAFLGSMQLLPNRNAVVGWGSRPFFSEYSGSGKQLLDAVFPGKDQSYRALFTPNWVGTPSYPPSGALRTSGGNTTVYASWNGATQVAKWVVLGGSSRLAAEARSRPRRGPASRPRSRSAPRATRSWTCAPSTRTGNVLGAKLSRGRSGSGLPQSY